MAALQQLLARPQLEACKREGSIREISFGRADADGAMLWPPVSMGEHHAPMDGLHVGRHCRRLEALMAEPRPWREA